ncbi:MAG: amidohydrolase family protein [Desulfobacterota bacterium]|nr:amidohydrolase family protein [Thermodesulfobacteriota bacterium]
MLSDVALGNSPPDLVLNNANLFNSLTGEFIPGQSIWIKAGRVAYVGNDSDFKRDPQTRVIDAGGMTVLPGLIDGHTHTVSNRYGTEEFIRFVIPTGVTTVVTELMETATVSGKEGIEVPVAGFDEQPIRIYHTVPPVCGLTPVEEVMAPTLDEFIALLKHPKCLGIGEIYWGNLFLEGEQGERLKKLIAIALAMGKVVEGHTAGAPLKKLQAYAGFGISSCHEPITEEEVLERLRQGYWVMIRQGWIRKELPGVAGIFQRKIDLRRLTLTTDGVDPEAFLEEGYLDGAVRTALKMGISPPMVYQMVTLNVAEHFRLDPLLGSLTPGKMADLVMIPSPEEFSPRLVMCDGKIIFQDGKSLVEPRRIQFPKHLFSTVNIPHYTIPSLPTRGKVRVMELVSRLVTRESFVDLDNPEESSDLNMVLALDRLGSGEAFMGFLKGFGLQRGAYGTTASWDATDILVVGCDPSSIGTVVERSKEIGGGFVYAIGSEIVAECPAPLFGLMSLKPMETVRREVRRIEEALNRNGVRWERPMLTVDTLSTAAIPHLRITHRGYVRLKDREILPL